MGYKHVIVNCRKNSECMCHYNSYLQASYYHILRGNNATVEKLANQGVKNNLCLVSIKGQHTYHKHVP